MNDLFGMEQSVRGTTPNTPLTGTGIQNPQPPVPFDGGLQRRKLPGQQPSIMDQMMMSYIPPASPDALAQESDPKRGIAVQMARRRL